jgi:hypothetical protein
MRDMAAGDTGHIQRGAARRRERTLTLIGALIVFFTFIAKEAIKEHVKEKTDAINGARTLNTIRNDIQGLMQGEDWIASRLAFEQQSTHKSQSVSMQLIQYQEVSIARMSSTVAQTLNAAAELLKQAPDADLRERLSGLWDQWKVFDKEADQFATDAKNPSMREAVNDRYVPLLTKGSGISNELLIINAKISVHAWEVLERSERELNVWTWISYVLYALGWGLALYARLSGVGITEQGE